MTYFLFLRVFRRDDAIEDHNSRFLSIIELDEIIPSEVDLLFDFINSDTEFVGNELYPNVFQEF